MDWGDGMNVKRVWRKGRKWRVETLLPISKKWPLFPSDADAAWWKKHQLDYTPQVQAICDGEKVYYYRAEGNLRGLPRDRHALKLTMTQAINPSDDPFMPWPDMFPEHLGHPDVWQPTHDRDFLLDPKPADGPPGTVRLKYATPALPSRRVPTSTSSGSVPERSYIAVRSRRACSNRRNPPKVAYVDTRILEGLARSPSGSWYATRVRRKTSDFNTEQVWTYHVDFEVQMPDEMFRPLK